MGAMAAAEIDRWLGDGGLVVTASDRAARALASNYHRHRMAEGRKAWPAPKILDWSSLVRRAWEERAKDSRLLLSPLQEKAIWAEIATEDRSYATLLEGPRYRLATLAMEAHDLLCSYAPRYLEGRKRECWQQDAGSFSEWLSVFEERCHGGSLLSSSRIPRELVPLLKTDLSERPPLLLYGFDRILPVQRELFDVWGAWRQAGENDAATEVHFDGATDTQSELTACARWCKGKLAEDAKSRLLIVTQDAGTRRGELERTLRRHVGDQFEFSLGIPLSRVALGGAMMLVLRWLDGSLQEQELDWLISTGFIAASAEEGAALGATMRALRRQGLERPRWGLPAFLGQRAASESLPSAWQERMTRAKQLLDGFARRPQSPHDWAELAPRLLEELHFAGSKALSSAEYQAMRRCEQALEGCGSLGFDGRRISWQEFLSQLERTLEETLFAPESRNAPIQIAGPAESAGLTADAIWFLGADEESWPSSGSTHPFLPIEVQREAGMPHATAHHDWELARSMTNRLMASAPEVHFSYARQNEGTEARPSRLIVQIAREARTLPTELCPEPASAPMTEEFEDSSQIPFPQGKIAGGAAVLTAQSQCPFKAFASARLDAQDWEAAEAGLSAKQRGQLLHDVLHSVWGGPPSGIRTQAEVLVLNDRESFVAGHVRRAMQSLPSHLRERMPRRYLALEELRLVQLVSEWLEFETARVEFHVAATELKRTVSIGGLDLNLRLDRIDRLQDGSLLVVDYKTGAVSPKLWEMPRPEDVQLPLYAGFALSNDEVVGGVVFANVRAGEMKFAGHVRDAKATINAGLKGTSTLLKVPLSGEMLSSWRDCVEQLAADFIAGRAEVDPKEYPKTCERCDLQALCRIQEQRGRLGDEDEQEDAEDGDE